MEPQQMLMTAAALLSAGALGGLTMAALRLRGSPRPPSWLAMGHGLLAASGLTLLAYAACTTGIPWLAEMALLTLLAAAAGGAAINLLFHAQQKPLPIPYIVGHALVAASGLVMLLIAILRPSPG